MKNFILFFLLIGIVACSKKEASGLVVTGHIKDLKKGTVYLKKIGDTAVITIDSMEIVGESKFKLESPIEEPEVFYLVLDKNDTDEGRIQFFGNKGITNINTSLKSFSYNAKISGSKQQDVYQEYLKVSNKFNNNNLDIIKENFDARKDNDSIKAMETDIKYKNLIKRKYLYTINFALNNRTSHVAPYVALTELYDAQIKYLDTIYMSLPDSIATSKYGKELKILINERKAL